MMDNQDGLYSFVFRGLLAEEALDRTGRKPKGLSDFNDEDIAKSISIDLLDEELVAEARRMSVVYTAIAAFENSVRALVSKVLLESVGETWWESSVSEKIKSRAKSRFEEEQKVKWHTQRGKDPINYSELPDLVSIIRNNWERFEPYIHSIEWAASIFDMLERSRNVIMHSGSLEKSDIERVGIQHELIQGGRFPNPGVAAAPLNRHHSSIMPVPAPVIIAILFCKRIGSSS